MKARSIRSFVRTRFSLRCPSRDHCLSERKCDRRAERLAKCLSSRQDTESQWQGSAVSKRIQMVLLRGTHLSSKAPCSKIQTLSGDMEPSVHYLRWQHYVRAGQSSKHRAFQWTLSMVAIIDSRAVSFDSTKQEPNRQRKVHV